MADVREENRFGPIEFRQLFEAFLFFLGGPGVLNGRSYMTCGKREERLISSIHSSRRVHTGNQNSDRLFVGAGRDGQNDGFGNRLAGRAARQGPEIPDG